MNNTKNKTLIKAAQKGDRQAFEALIREHYDVMYRMAFKWCGDRDMAQDVVQDSCIKVARNIDSFRFQSSFTSWLYRIVVNTAKDRKRQDSRFTSFPEDDAIFGSTDDYADQLHAQQMLLLIQRLPENEKTAILLVYGEGLTHSEAAFSMQCRESTVSWYIHKARKNLRSLENGGCQDG